MYNVMWCKDEIPYDEITCNVMRWDECEVLICGVMSWYEMS